MNKILFWLYRPHKKEIFFILQAIANPPAGIVPTRKLLLLPHLLENKKLKREEDFDQLVNYMKNAGYVSVSDAYAIGLTDEGKKLLMNYQNFWLLRPIKIIQNALKENLTAIISFLALIISVITLIYKK